MERKRVATEWDGCWFCDKCYSMHHWKEEAYVENGEKLCKDCYERRYKRYTTIIRWTFKDYNEK